jgi:hypothetical protein
VISELNYKKAAFLKEHGKKQGRLVWLFQKQKHFKSQIKHPLSSILNFEKNYGDLDAFSLFLYRQGMLQALVFVL